MRTQSGPLAPAAADAAPGTPGSPSAAAALALDQVSVALGARRILHGIDLRIMPGEFVTLLGANGSGKSTLLRAAVGILPLAYGTASVFGENVSRRRAHRHIGYVPQYAAEPSTIPATAAETVATGLLRPGVLSTRVRRPEVRTALEKVGVADLAERPVTEMSGGQRQRVMIARALVRNPQLLVLDEPFAGVDLASQRAIAGIFRELNAAGTTLLVILHSLGELAHELSRAVILDTGRIIYDGPPLQAPHGTIGHEHDHDVPDAAGIGQEMIP